MGLLHNAFKARAQSGWEIVRYSYIFVILCFMLIPAIGLVYFCQQLFNSYERIIDANLKTKLILIQLEETERLVKFTQEKPITLLFVGDIMLSRGVVNQIKKHQDYNFPFLKIATTTREADLTFGNLEGPISERGVNQGSAYSFRSEPKIIEGLNSAGFDILSLANNHIWDYGKDALVDTIVILGHSNINSVGVGRNYKEANEPVILGVNLGTSDVHVLKVAFFAYTNLYPDSFRAGINSAGISDFDLEKIKERIKSVKDSKLADIVVTSFHWGEEYQAKANESQKSIAHELIDAGADLVIGHHPHVVQEVEQYPPSPEATARQGKNAWIAYSLGNFVFDQNFSEETNNGLILKVIIKNKKVQSIEPIKIKINSTFQPEIQY